MIHGMKKFWTCLRGQNKPTIEQFLAKVIVEEIL